jgi:hypothetical protein
MRSLAIPASRRVSPATRALPELAAASGEGRSTATTRPRPRRRGVTSVSGSSSTGSASRNLDYRIATAHQRQGFATELGSTAHTAASAIDATVPFIAWTAERNLSSRKVAAAGTDQLRAGRRPLRRSAATGLRGPADRRVRQSARTGTVMSCPNRSQRSAGHRRAFPSDRYAAGSFGLVSGSLGSSPTPRRFHSRSSTATWCVLQERPKRERGGPRRSPKPRRTRSGQDPGNA